jgi:hypothetical protein
MQEHLIVDRLRAYKFEEDLTLVTFGKPSTQQLCVPRSKPRRWPAVVEACHMLQQASGCPMLFSKR